MQDATAVPKAGENVWLWLTKIISGLIVFVVLTIHLIVNHYVAPEGLFYYDEVINYFKNPLIPIMEGTFLVFVVIHSLLGLRSIILDRNPTQKVMRVVDTVFVVVGLTAIVYGIWLLVYVTGLG